MTDSGPRCACGWPVANAYAASCAACERHAECIDAVERRMVKAAERAESTCGKVYGNNWTCRNPLPCRLHTSLSDSTPGSLFTSLTEMLDKAGKESRDLPELWRAKPTDSLLDRVARWIMAGQSFLSEKLSAEAERNNLRRELDLLQNRATYDHEEWDKLVEELLPGWGGWDRPPWDAVRGFVKALKEELGKRTREIDERVKQLDELVIERDEADSCRRKAEARVAELERELAAKVAPDVQTADQIAKVLIMQAEQRAEAALPECVREWRGWVPSFRERIIAMLKMMPIENAAGACLEWLATAPAASVARIGLCSNMVGLVKAWQQDSSNKDRTATVMLDDLEHAEVYDVDELVPLLEATIWNKIPEQWQKLVCP